jgi:4-carboxymuconolactone decarboxylase
MDDREEGLRQFRELIPPSVFDVDSGVPEGAFAPELADLALSNVYGRLWARAGLDRRSRSLVTLGILIALRATEPLKINLLVAVRNGLTKQELEEVVYHASGYAGFPAATEAARIAAEVFDTTT